MKKIFYVLALFVCSLFSCEYVNRKIGLPDDNFIEEGIEEGIKNKIGIDIDLTPQSPERSL